MVLAYAGGVPGLYTYMIGGIQKQQKKKRRLRNPEYLHLSYARH